MKIKKKGVVASNLVNILVVIVSLLVLLFVVVIPFVEFGDEQSHLVECQTLFSQLDGQPVYFGNDRVSPTSNLYESIQTRCPSRDLSIQDDTVTEVANLIEECWTKTDSGSDIFAGAMQGDGICLYCGRAIADEDIDNFREDLVRELSSQEYSDIFEPAETVNMNEFTLSQDFPMPESLSEGEGITIFYKTYRPEKQYNPEGSRSFGEFITEEVFAEASDAIAGAIGGNYAVINSHISERLRTSVDTYSGVFVGDYQEFNETEDELGREPHEGLTYTGNCRYIVPNEDI